MSETSVLIVGGGILGTMHALSAVDRGYKVTQIEREVQARGASLRNFGLVWVSGRAKGREDVAAVVKAARRGWRVDDSRCCRRAGHARARAGTDRADIDSARTQARRAGAEVEGIGGGGGTAESSGTGTGRIGVPQ